MLINMVLPGAAGSAEEPFAFEYSGNYTDNRVDGIGTVRLNTSGTLTVTGAPVTVTATIVGGGGGGFRDISEQSLSASGGGGGIQTVEVILGKGVYEITIGTGGEGKYTAAINASAGSGGATIAFGKTSTGGAGAAMVSANPKVGAGGTPNGQSGKIGYVAGGSPNGGGATSTTAAGNNGGDGYVELTFI